MNLVRFEDIKKRLLQSYRDDGKELANILDQQNALRSEYRRYLDLDARRVALERRMERTLVAYGPDDFEDIRKSEKSGKDTSRTVAIVIDRDLPLWQVIVAILEQYGELQVIQLELALDRLGHKTSRSAIESSLKTHPDEFKIRTSGRAKFVSLKGA
jgi:hypothetical protein